MASGRELQDAVEFQCQATTPKRNSRPLTQIRLAPFDIKPLGDPILSNGSLSRENETSAQFVFVRAEGFLFSLGPLSLVAHFARNAQAFSERVYRLAGVGGTSLIRALTFTDRPLPATRLLHAVLRGMSRDRLDLLGEEYFDYVIRPKLRTEGLERVRQSDPKIVLFSQELDHLMRPLALHLDIHYLLTNRLEFRDDLATGRLLSPVIVSTDGTARFTTSDKQACTDWKSVRQNLEPEWQERSPSEVVFSSVRRRVVPKAASVRFSKRDRQVGILSVRKALLGKQILIIGTTGFIGKVWLTMLLEDLPELGKIYLLVRRQGSRSALQRFERIVAESPAFKHLHDQHGEGLGDWLAERIEVVEGDVSEPRLGLDEETARRLAANLDLIVNSAGLTDFNPDLGLALSTNADSALHLVEFLRTCNHAGLVHVSTCFVNGRTDGRVPEEVHANYTPHSRKHFDARCEWEFLHAELRRVEEEGNDPVRTAEFRAEALRKRQNWTADDQEKALLNAIRKTRARWVRNRLIELGIERAHYWGWPNIYTFTKSLGESFLASEAAELPIAIARPSIVESSIEQPFRGWNEGVNTTAPLSYLLGTYFRQLPSNKRKRLDVIPVDLVCRGLTLISAAVVLRCHDKVYQLATSATNPANMRRTIELTGLAHRKYYRSLEGLEHWVRARFDTIAVSKSRYHNVSLPRFQWLIARAQRVLSPLSLKGDLLARKQRALDKVQKVIELYEPFILDNEYFFAADHIKELAQALPAEELADFDYDADAIGWYDYWINLHVPALRRWTYPLIEGRRPDTGLLARNFKLSNRPTGFASPDDVSSSDSPNTVEDSHRAEPSRSPVDRAVGQ